MKSCVVSFADSKGDYQKKMIRLEQSLKGNFDGDFIGFTSHEEIGCKPHSEIPYQFKPFAISKAYELGYELILWCDSPIVAVKNIQPVFDYIERHGYVFFDNIGHSLGKWSNDECLRYFFLSREDAMNIKMIMACCMGFNFSGPVVKWVFHKYKSLSDTLYKGSWWDHRHDQTVMSCIIHTYDLDIIVGQDTFFAYEQHHGVLPIADSVCLISK